jgi:hypothetical protein
MWMARVAPISLKNSAAVKMLSVYARTITTETPADQTAAKCNSSPELICIKVICWFDPIIEVFSTRESQIVRGDSNLQ